MSSTYRTTGKGPFSGQASTGDRYFTLARRIFSSRLRATSTTMRRSYSYAITLTFPIGAIAFCRVPVYAPGLFCRSHTPAGATPLPEAHPCPPPGFRRLNLAQEPSG